jgi:uncharacterized protein (TIGR03435 family)
VTAFGLQPGRAFSRAVPLEYLAVNLGASLGRLVIDKSGLSGKFDYTLTWTPQTAAAGDEGGPSLFTALEQQLGLRLVSTKGPVAFVVIDRVEKPDAN